MPYTRKQPNDQKIKCLTLFAKTIAAQGDIDVFSEPFAKSNVPSSPEFRHGTVAKIDDDTYQVQVVSWYDNENSYTSQMVRTIKYFAELN